MSSINKWLIVCSIISLFLLGCSWAYYQKILHTPVVSSPIFLEINKGDGFDKITAKLLSSGINVRPIWFKLAAHQNKVHTKLQAGEYELPTGATPLDILTIFSEGRAKKYAVTFPEGWSLKEILKQLEVTPNITQTLKDKSPEHIASLLGIIEKNPEGWLFPDTYYFERNTQDITILKIAHKKMQVVLQQEWQKKSADVPYKTPYEALTMASIVEKETGVKSERPMIAGVFVNRLKKGMLLQTDPTVIYGMGDAYKGNIRVNDLHTRTAYNTYVISGLPPTPIAMPGQDAIYAALNPSKGDNLYFVAKGDGSHQFSVSLSDHNHAVNIFQKKLHVR
jgi:UPF0755 protein